MRAIITESEAWKITDEEYSKSVVYDPFDPFDWEGPRFTSVLIYDNTKHKAPKSVRVWFQKDIDKNGKIVSNKTHPELFL